MSRVAWLILEMFSKNVVADSRPFSVHDFDIKAVITNSKCDPRTTWSSDTTILLFVLAGNVWLFCGCGCCCSSCGGGGGGGSVGCWRGFGAFVDGSVAIGVDAANGNGEISFFVTINIWKLLEIDESNLNNLSINCVFLFKIGWSSMSNNAANGDDSKSTSLFVVFVVLGFKLSVKLVRWLFVAFGFVMIIDETFCNGLDVERFVRLWNDWSNLRSNSQNENSRIVDVDFDGVAINCLSGEFAFVVGSFDERIAAVGAGCNCIWWSGWLLGNGRNCSGNALAKIINESSTCRQTIGHAWAWTEICIEPWRFVWPRRRILNTFVRAPKAFSKLIVNHDGLIFLICWFSLAVGGVFDGVCDWLVKLESFNTSVGAPGVVVGPSYSERPVLLFIIDSNARIIQCRVCAWLHRFRRSFWRRDIFKRGSSINNKTSKQQTDS